MSKPRGGRPARGLTPAEAEARKRLRDKAASFEKRVGRTVKAAPPRVPGLSDLNPLHASLVALLAGVAVGYSPEVRKGAARGVQAIFEKWEKDPGFRAAASAALFGAASRGGPGEE